VNTEAAPRELVQLRPAFASEAPFVFRNWLDSYFPEQRTRLKKTVFYEGHHRLIEKLLARSRVLVACNAQDSGQLYGFAVGESFGEPLPSVFALHYVYVKQPFRRMGIGSRLVREMSGEAETLLHSHETETGRAFGVALRSVFNPYAGGITQ
jgi:GNAT superfamily N-acetyltransferase